MSYQEVTQEEFEQIEAYLNHSLSDQDMVSIEERIKNDVVFKQKVEDIKIVIQGIEVQSMKEKLNEFHNKILLNSASNQKTIHTNWKKIAIAAVFVIAAGSIWWMSNNSSSNLYDTYFSPDPGLPTTMSSNNNYEFYKAMVDYKQGNYNLALEQWQTQLKTKPENDTLNYFIGSALLANKQNTEAETYLNKVSKMPYNTFKNEALFYLGLIALKNNNTEKAIEYLENSNLPESKTLINELK